MTDIESAYSHRFGTSPTVIARAPGRVNLLGEHVDYNDGLVLPVAIDRAVQLAAEPASNNNITLHALDLNQEISFSLDALEEKVDLQGKPLPGWALYPAGVAWSLREAGYPVPGLQTVYSSDIPIGAGLSSSAAIEVGFAALWQALGGWNLNCLELAKLCQHAENEYVGVSCGLMDQFASACGVDRHALYFDTRSQEYETAPLPDNIVLIIADSGVRRNLTNSAYNQRRAECEQALNTLQIYMPGIQSLRDVPATEFAAYSVFLADIPRKRAEHVIKEIARVESAFHALQRDDMQALSALMYAGHASLRKLFEVSTPELDTLVKLSRQLPGCVGARLTGAGFGGCTINLVEIDHADSFMQGIETGYYQATGIKAQVYLCHASQGAAAAFTSRH